MNGGVQRQHLAAILMADAVGYSRSMEMDEHGTLAALEAARSVFRTHVDANRGRVIDTSGDSILAVFDSAAGAVIAALAVPGSLDAAPGRTAGPCLRFRIGVHLGDVIETENQGVYGDGVNIAARLQALADPGGILVSEAVRGAVKSRIPATFADRGLQGVKNIGDPVRAYAVTGGSAGDAATVAVAPTRPRRQLSRRLGAGAMAAALAVAVALYAWWWRSTESRAVATSPQPAAPSASPALPASGKTSIAVLPFDNMSGDPEQLYFADGITEDLITDLSKVNGLFVIARHSTFVYKDKAHDAREIAQKLGVQYVLEGSVRKSGTEVRVNAQLIEASTGGHVWADRYDGDLRNIFALQDTVTRSVVKALAVTLSKEESDQVARRGTDNVEAYDLFLKGWERYLRQTPEEFRAAIVDFKRAVELDPRYGRAHAALATIYWETFTRFWGLAVGSGPRNEDALGEAELFLAKAMRAPTPLAYQVASAMQLQGQQHDGAIAEAKRSIASDRNDANGYIALAGALSLSGRPVEALDAVDMAMRLNPHYPSSYLYQRGLAQFTAGRVDDAAVSLEHAMAMKPDDYWSQRLLLSTYGLLGRGDAAHRLLETMNRHEQRGQTAFHDPLTIRAMIYWYPFTRPEDAQRFVDGLAKAGVPQ